MCGATVGRGEAKRSDGREKWGKGGLRGNWRIEIEDEALLWHG